MVIGGQCSLIGILREKEAISGRLSRFLALYVCFGRIRAVLVKKVVGGEVFGAVFSSKTVKVEEIRKKMPNFYEISRHICEECSSLAISNEDWHINIYVDKKIYTLNHYSYIFNGNTSLYSPNKVHYSAIS